MRIASMPASSTVRENVLAAQRGASTRLGIASHGSEEHRALALAAGFDAHIARPVDVAHLRREIAAARKA